MGITSRQHWLCRAVAGVALALGCLCPAVPLALASDGPSTDTPVTEIPIDENNSEDTGFHFDFTFPGATAGTSGREKQDDTPSYVNITNMTIYDVNLYIDGMGFGNAWYNKTNGGVAYIIDPGEWAIHNTVYESGMRMARMTGWSPDEDGVLGGVWSPDSAYWHRPAN